MPFIRFAQRNILFIHIPRTGGTTVEHWLSQLGALGLHSYSLPNVMRVTPQHLRVNDVEELIGDNYFEYTFAIVRNPFDRIASEFRLRRKLALEGVFNASPRFSSWLENQLDAARKNPFHLDNHFRPQWEFVSSAVDVYKYEDGLREILTKVAEKIGAPAPAALPQKLSTGDLNESVRFDIADVERIRSVYAADFERFGYAATPPAVG